MSRHEIDERIPVALRFDWSSWLQLAGLWVDVLWVNFFQHLPLVLVGALYKAPNRRHNDPSDMAISTASMGAPVASRARMIAARAWTPTLGSRQPS